MSQGPDPQQLVELRLFACDLLARAGAVPLRHFRNLEAVANKAREGEMDPVTEADRAAEAFIREQLAARFPDHGVTGEESGGSVGSSDWGWTIDPIDGTRGYVAGFLHWAMLLALSWRGRPVLGVVHQPYTGEFWWGLEPDQAGFRRGENEQRLRVRRGVALQDALLATTDPYLFEGAEADVFARLRQSVAVTRYSADSYAYCMLAQGQLDLVVESGLKAWDVRALIPLIEGAGGVITSWCGDACHDGGQVLAAASPALHREVMALLAPAAAP